MPTNTLKHSLYGRFFGISYDDMPIAEKSFQESHIEEATSGSTSTKLKPYGHTRLITGAADNFVLEAPIPGVRKTITAESTLTGARTVTLESGRFLSQSATDANELTFNAAGESVTLMGVTTGIYAVIANENGVTVTSTT